MNVGDSTSLTFTVDEAAMRSFAGASGDHSLIHSDAAFAQSRGYAGPVVYGGIMVAHLSRVLGMSLPGPTATSISWTIKFHEPLYVGESATLVLTVSFVSSATGVVESKFKIATGTKVIASGTTQSIVPH
jgi:3-hydroxybutyryl-CoA dehydratase